MLSDAHVQAFIDRHQVEARLVYPGVPTPTVLDAAQALQVPVERVIKSLIFMADGAPVLVIAAGESRVSLRRLADTLELSKRKLRFATPEQAQELSGYPVGAMPPFAHKQPLMTLMDDTINGEEIVYGGGGTKQAMLAVAVPVLKQVTNARYAALCEDT